MTIERLEELHTLTGQLSKEMIDAALWTDEAVDYAYDIRELIDAEIDRQRVTDEGSELIEKIEQLPCDGRKL